MGLTCSQEKTRQGLDVQNVMTQAVVPGLQNPNNEVRNEAIAIIAALSCLVDDRAVIDEHLEGLKPALLVAIEVCDTASAQVVCET